MTLVLIANLEVTHDGEKRGDASLFVPAIKRELKLRLQQFNEQGGMEISRNLDAVSFNGIKIVIGD